MARVARRQSFPLLGRIARFGLSADVTTRARGLVTAALGGALVGALASYHAGDPSFDASSAGAPANWLGAPGATIADLATQSLGLASWAIAITLMALGLQALFGGAATIRRGARLRVLAALLGFTALAGALAAPAHYLKWQSPRSVFF